MLLNKKKLKGITYALDYQRVNNWILKNMRERKVLDILSFHQLLICRQCSDAVDKFLGPCSYCSTFGRHYQIRERDTVFVSSQLGKITVIVYVFLKFFKNVV